MNVALKRQSHEGEELYALFRTSMKPYVEASRGAPWDEQRERAQFLAQLAPRSVHLILVDDRVVGFVDLRADDRGSFLHTMVIAPKWQSRGIGGAVLEQLKSQSDRISLTVLKANPRARRFYERAGFHKVGATEHHYWMAWASRSRREL